MILRGLWVAVLIAGLVGTGAATAGPAQEVLEDLAHGERTARVTSGLTSIGLGVAVGVGGFVVLSGSGMEIYGALAGALIAVPGVVTLMVPSAAERELAEAGDAELEAALALERLAESGRRERIVSGIAHVAAGIASLLYPFGFVTPYDHVYSAVTSFGMAAVDFLLPSKEERALARYERLAQASG